MPHIVVEPVRVRRHDDELGCEVSRIVAYRARCGDHWRGPHRGSISVAVADGKQHIES